MPPPIGPPVLNRYSTSPFCASTTVKWPVSSPAKTKLPDVAVTAATTGRGDRYFQRICPVDASTAVIQPCEVASRFADPPKKPRPLVYLMLSDDMKLEHQSTAPTYNIFVPGLYAGPFHSAP